MKTSYSWVFYLVLFSGSSCGRAFSSWIVLEDILLTDKSILKKLLGFLPYYGFREENLCVLLFFNACISFSDPIVYGYCITWQFV